MADEQSETKGKSKIVVILLVVLIVIMLALGLVLFFMINNSNPDDTGSVKDAAVSSDSAPQQSVATQPSAQGNANYIRIGSLHQLDQFIVNLMSQNGRRYLKTTISLEMTDDKLESEINAKLPAVRDTIIDVLSSKSMEEVSTTRGRERIKQEIVQRLNEFLVDGKIRNMFFVDYAIQ